MPSPRREREKEREKNEGCIFRPRPNFFSLSFPILASLVPRKQKNERHFLLSFPPNVSLVFSYFCIACKRARGRSNIEIDFCRVFNYFYGVSADSFHIFCRFKFCRLSLTIELLFFYDRKRVKNLHQFYLSLSPDSSRNTAYDFA